MQIKTKPEVYKQIKVMYPKIDWVLFEDLDRAINWELWHGPLGKEYWNREDGVEPLDKYDWQGFDKAVADIIALLDPLPQRLWVDDDDCVYYSDPEQDSYNWRQECRFCEEIIYDEDDICGGDDERLNKGFKHEPDDREEGIWVGPQSYQEIDVRRYMMHDESWKQVF